MEASTTKCQKAFTARANGRGTLCWGHQLCANVFSGLSPRLVGSRWSLLLLLCLLIAIALSQGPGLTRQSVSVTLSPAQLPDVQGKYPVGINLGGRQPRFRNRYVVK